MNDINGGQFSKNNQKIEEAKKKESQGQDTTQFITDEPSLIKTEDVFAMLGEQLVRTANWKKISLSWQSQYKILSTGIIQLKTKYEELVASNKQLADSNIKYVEINKSLDGRITELNKLLKESIEDKEKFEKDYCQLDLRFSGVVSHNNKLNKTIEEYNVKISDKDSELKKLGIKLIQLKGKGTKKSRKKSVNNK